MPKRTAVLFAIVVALMMCGNSAATQPANKSYYGDWYLVAPIYTNFPGALTEPDVKALVGHRVSYGSGFARSGTGRCDHVEYVEKRFDENDVWAWFRIDARRLGLAKRPIEFVDVESGDCSVVPPLLLVKDADTLFGFYKGVFFEMKRVPPSRGSNRR